MKKRELERKEERRQEKKKRRSWRTGGRRHFYSCRSLLFFFPRRLKLRFGASITQSWGRTVVLFSCCGRGSDARIRGYSALMGTKVSAMLVDL